jgi:hypothetical protein
MGTRLDKRVGSPALESRTKEGHVRKHSERTARRGRSPRALLCAALAGAVATGGLGCSALRHDVQLEGFNARGAGLTRSKEKRVAVVLAEPAMQSTYETATDGHAWVFDGVKQYYEQAFRRALSDSVASVQFFGVTPSSGDFDAYIVPELKIDASGMLSHSCTATYAVTVKDKAGRVVKREEHEAKESFFAMADGERACKAALSSSFMAATYPALRQLDRM